MCKLLTLCALLVLPGLPAWAASKTAAAKKTAPASPKSKAKSGGKAASGAVKKGKPAASRQRTPSGPPRQMAPTRERYMEVQQALADKGYYTGPIDGSWGSECVDALRRFQGDQNIPVDGKLGALSLIGLGLGPKREPLQTQMLAKPAPGITPNP